MVYYLVKEVLNMAEVIKNIEDRKYLLNRYYINELMSEKNIILKDISKKLKMTENALYLKFLGISRIYIHEAIIIANCLEMSIWDIFCPLEGSIKDTLLKNKPYSDTFIKYRKFNQNRDYIVNLLKNKGFTLQNLADLWSVKISTVYPKLRGYDKSNGSKMVLQDAIMLAQLLEMDFNDIFCQTLKMENQELLANKLNNTYHNIDDDFPINNIYVEKEFIKYLFDLKEIKPFYKKLCSLWKISRTAVDKKLIGNAKLSIKQAIELANLVEVNINDLINKENELYKDFLKFKNNKSRSMR
jgi:lambda repressor-like predicted transcriptional regulator